MSSVMNDSDIAIYDVIFFHMFATEVFRRVPISVTTSVWAHKTTQELQN
jgi:hypothetical protein